MKLPSLIYFLLLFHIYSKPDQCNIDFSVVCANVQLVTINIYEEEMCLPRKIVFCFNKQTVWLSTPICPAFSLWLLVTAVREEHWEKIIRINLKILKLITKSSFQIACMYCNGPHNNTSVNDRLLIWGWSHKIIVELKFFYHLVYCGTLIAQCVIYVFVVMLE